MSHLETTMAERLEEGRQWCMRTPVCQWAALLYQSMEQQKNCKSNLYSCHVGDAFIQPSEDIFVPSISTFFASTDLPVGSS